MVSGKSLEISRAVAITDSEAASNNPTIKAAPTWTQWIYTKYQTVVEELISRYLTLRQSRPNSNA
jgi:hypothetical protein